ncbi:hypothetical protein Tco_1310391 [Tanacetum coccineum]
MIAAGQGMIQMLMMQISDPFMDDEPMSEVGLTSILKHPRTTVSTEVHQAAETVTTSNELDLLFGPLFDEYFNGENQVVLKSSAVTTTDASNKRQQQPDSTSSTSTLATTVTANGNFDLLGISPMIQPDGGSTQGYSIVRNSSLVMMEKNVYKGKMPTKIELTLEQSQQGVSNDVLVSIEGVEE